MSVLEAALAEVARRRTFAWRVVLTAMVAAAIAQPLGRAAWHELTYDRWIPSVDRIYRIQGQAKSEDGTTVLSARAPGVAAPFLSTDVSAFSPGSIVARAVPRRVVAKNQNEPSFVEALLVYPNFASVFALPVLGGGQPLLPAAVLQDPASIVVTEAFARRQFGASDVVGKAMTLEIAGSDRPMRIAAVLRDFPGPTHLKFDALVLLQPSYFPNEPWVLAEWFANSAYTYVRLGAARPARELTSWLGEFQRARTPGFAGNSPSRNELLAVPIDRIHLGASGKSDMRGSGAWKDVLSLAAAAFMAIGTCAAVVVMLCAAESAHRRGELKVRLALGASVNALRAARLVELSGLLLIGTIVGTLVGLIIASLLRQSGIGADLSVKQHMSTAWPAVIWFILATSGLLLFAATGSAMSPRVRPNGRITALGLGVQYFATSLLAGSAYIWYVTAQSNASVDVGFRAENLFVAHSAKPSEQGAVPPELLERIARDRSFQGAAAALVVPGENFAWSVDVAKVTGAKPIRAEVNFVTPTYFEVLGTRLVSGRSFRVEASADDISGREASTLRSTPIAIVADEELALSLGFQNADDAVGAVVELDHWLDPVTLQAEIIGVVARHALLPAQARQMPARVFVFDGRWASSILARARPGVGEAEALEALARHWRSSFKDTPFRGNPASEKFASYEARIRAFLLLFALGTVAALTVCVLGTHAVMYQQLIVQEREVAIRRTLGATMRQEAVRIVQSLVTAAGLGLIAAILLLLLFGYEYGEWRSMWLPQWFLVVIASVPVAIASLAAVARVASHIRSNELSQSLKSAAR